MKKIFLICIIAVLFLGVSSVRAQQNATGTQATPSATPINDKVQELKDRLATKVAELRQLEKRAIEGIVKSKTISILIVETKTKDVRIELSDEIKVVQYLKGKRTMLTLDDVAKDDKVVVFGQYDTGLEILKAKAILIDGTPPVRIFGTITDIKKSDYTISVAGIDGLSYLVDFETTTKTNAWTAGNGVEKGGFSKLYIGDTVSVVGTPVPKKENRISAIRILTLGDLTGQRPSPTLTPTPTEKPSPSKSPTPTE